MGYHACSLDIYSEGITLTLAKSFSEFLVWCCCVVSELAPVLGLQILEQEIESSTKDPRNEDLGYVSI